MNCWICGQDATTKEHKIKRSTLKKLYKKEFQHGNMLHFKDDTYKKIQGIDSNKIKYQKSLCAKCNNEFTQPFDKAFDLFQDYIITNYKDVSQFRIIDFYNIYGNNFPKQQTDLFKYFIKMFGCDLKEYGFNIPFDLIDLLHESQFKTKMRISFSIDENLLNSIEPTRALYGMGELITSKKNIETKQEKEPWYIFELKLAYLSVNFFYSYKADVGLGSEWIANKRFLYLGSNNHRTIENLDLKFE